MISAKALQFTPEQMKVMVPGAFYEMLWALRADPRFSYWARFPKSYLEDKADPDKKLKLVIMVHGTGGEAAPYFPAMQKYMDEHDNCALLAPVFPSGLFFPNDWDSYKLLRCDGVAYDLALLQMVEEFRERYPMVETDKFYICGHSGGGQFVNRFIYAHPDRLAAACISAPGRPTFPDMDADYFWGIRDFKKHFEHDVDFEELKNVPVHVSVGERDTDFIDERPYGNTRVERGQTLARMLREKGVNACFELIPGVKHRDGNDERMNAWMKFFEQYFQEHTNIEEYE